MSPGHTLRNHYNDVKIAGYGHYEKPSILRIDNALDAITQNLSQSQSDLANLLHQRDAAKLEVDKPFPQEAELQQKSARLIELDAALNMEAGPAAEPICEEGDADLPDQLEQTSIQARLQRAHEENEANEPSMADERKQSYYEEAR